MKLTKSWKKATAALLGSLIVGVGGQLGLSEQTTMEIASIVVAYILGQGIADQGKGAKEIAP